MADDNHDMHTGICSSGGGGGGWWNNNPSASVSSFDEPSPPADTDVAINRGSLSWRTANEESAGSASASSSVTFQEANKAQFSSFDLSSPNLDWTQSLLRSTGGRSDSGFQAMLHDQVHIGLDGSTINPFKEMNHNFALDDHQQQHLSSGNTETAADINAASGFPFILPSSFGCSPPKLQGLFGPEMKMQPYDNRAIDYRFPATAYQESSSSLLQPTWGKFSDLLRGSPPKQTPSNQLQFSNNAPFWNASAGALISDSQLHTEFFESKTVQSNLSAAKESIRDSCSSSSNKRTSTSEEISAIKKPRMETPSPLPTFKVRKEKLGDRITALQQLVSPFGKTDTASVLHEAILYIKFLHDQVSVLSTPYLKKGPPMQQQKGPDKWKKGEGPTQDLRSRGLCLVPIASTYPVASETNADFWPPTFGGPLR